jgi:hypothetical protein
MMKSVIRYNRIDPAIEVRVEPGAFKVWIGPDSTVGLEGEFEIQQFSTFA